jgi:crotonobetainyl-CoA:carnitine CoA-transferase CaiB-like acyl-CoA transferase
MLAIITNSIWRRFCRFIGRDELAEDPRFHNDFARWEHRDIIDAVVTEWVASHTAEEIVTAAEQIPIPAGICNEQTDVAGHPQVKARDMLVEMPFPDGNGNMLVSGLPIRMSGTPTEIQRSFPAVGEHNEEIYCGLLGYNREDLTRLVEEGII